MIMDLNELLTFIIYGNVCKAPWNILDKNIFEHNPATKLDYEQTTRVSIAAAIKQLVEQGKLKI